MAPVYSSLINAEDRRSTRTTVQPKPSLVSTSPKATSDGPSLNRTSVMDGMAKIVMIVALTSSLMCVSDKWFNNDRLSDSALSMGREILRSFGLF
jgi:hypothetical protein